MFLPCDAPVNPMVPGVGLLGPGAAVEPRWGISVSPSQVIAPVGSEVVMIASVCGAEGFMLTRQRVEWMLAPDGVGQFMSPGQRPQFDVVDWWAGLPRKVDSRFVVNNTLGAPQTLDRGTPTPTDDVLVQSGQAWVSVTSPNEGTSKVTVFAPEIYGWDRRQQTATIYWVDAQWRLPAPSISPAGGSHGLTTLITRQSDNAPLVGWQVRYQITGGPEAGFAPDGASSVEVVTGATGEAMAQLVQKQPVAGTSQISIQIIRPTAIGQGQPIALGAGSTLHSWTSPAAAAIATPITSGAPTVRLGEPRASDTAASPQTFGGSAQPTAPASNEPQARHEPAGLGATDSAGNRAAESTGSPLRLSVQVSASRRQVGETVKLTIEVTNQSDRAIENLEVGDLFESALEPLRATEESTWLDGGALGWKIATLAPRSTIRRAIEFSCVRESPKSCHRVTTSAAGIEKMAEEACLEITDGQPASPPLQTDAAISVTVADTADPIKVGGETVYQILISNKSQQSIFDVGLTVTFTPELRFEGTTSPLPERPQILPAEIRYPVAREVRAGENPLNFELRFKGMKAGTGKVRAQVTSRSQGRVVTAEHETEVLE